MHVGRQAGEPALLQIKKIQVPETGALVIVSFPKPKGGSGFPARVFAICPR
jgi:kynurenine formamidase